MSSLGEPLLRAVRGELDREAQASPFLRTVQLSDRVTLAPAGVPVGALGAAIVARGGRP